MLLALLLFTAVQGPPPTPADTAALQVGSRVVTVSRARLGAADPSERAAAALRRIEAALATGADSVATRPAPDGMVVRSESAGSPCFAPRR